MSQAPKETSRASVQRIVTLALAVLDRSAYGSSTHRIDSDEVRLALAALWCILRDRQWLLAYYEKATNLPRHPWESCRIPFYGIAASLRKEGWHAPVEGVND